MKPDRPPPSVEEVLAAQNADDVRRAAIKALAERLYGHVFDAIDLDALFRTEQVLWSELHQLGVHDDEGELSEALLAEALFRVGHDPHRNFTMVPTGITNAERLAASFDDDCLMCKAELEDVTRRVSRERSCDLDDADAEWHAFEVEAARSWRLANASALRRFGLA